MSFETMTCVVVTCDGCRVTASDFDGAGDIHFASEQIAVDHLTEEDHWGQTGTQLLCADCYAACSTGDHHWREHIAPPGTLGPEQTSERALRACSRCETIDTIGSRQ